MKFLDLFLNSLVACISSLPLILLILTLQQDAGVPANPPLDQAQVNEIQQLLIDHDPRQLLASNSQEVRLTPLELNALLTYVKNSNPNLGAIRLRASLAEDRASLHLSIPVRAASLIRFFNITLHFDHVEDALALASVDAGALNFPARLLGPLGRAIQGQLQGEENFQLVSAFMESLHFVSINPERIVIRLDWQEETRRQLEDQARQVFVSSREAERLQFFHAQLTDTLASLPAGVNTVGLNDLLRPLFVFASLNTAAGENPVAENRAIFIVLTAYLTDLELTQLIGTELELATPRRVDVEIENREDLARHVVSSAAIAAAAGATMAEMLSVYKEVYDSRYRTGFSFTDIAANQAGSLLGTLASRSAADAILFQDQMKGSITESDYMPVLGTYDGMTEAEFVDLYGSRESQAYLQRVQEITDSILERPFYQAFVR